MAPAHSGKYFGIRHGAFVLFVRKLFWKSRNRGFGSSQPPKSVRLANSSLIHAKQMRLGEFTDLCGGSTKEVDLVRSMLVVDRASCPSSADNLTHHPSTAVYCLGHNFNERITSAIDRVDAFSLDCDPSHRRVHPSHRRVLPMFGNCMSPVILDVWEQWQGASVPLAGMVGSEELQWGSLDTLCTVSTVASWLRWY